MDLMDDDESKDSVGDLKGARKLKRTASTAEKKATHNAVERARRESLNGRFLVLADMLPGMNHVKRASKAAIVNKSIELIKELQSTETRLSTENESLRAEMAALKARLSLQPSAAAGNAMFPAHPQAAAAAAAALSSMPGMPGMHGFSAAPGLGLQQMGQAMAQQAAAVAAHQQQAAVAAAMQQEHMRSNSISSHVPIFPGVFNGMFNGPAPTMESLDNVRSESGSPSASTNAQLGNSNANNPFFQQGGFFDMLNTTTANVGGDALSGNSGGSSPLSYPSPTSGNTVFGSNGSTAFGGAAAKITDSPSAMSAHSISPAAYSPISLPSLTNIPASTGSSAGSTQEGPASPPLLEDTSALFAHFNNANNTADKASLDLQQFLAMQRLTGGAGAFNPFPALPTPSANQFPAMPSPQQQNHFCGAMNIPAWQMMMAHQHALTAYGGAQAPY